jgi:hypothetical protein
MLELRGGSPSESLVGFWRRGLNEGAKLDQAEEALALPR